jgi:hypothetical protein
MASDESTGITGLEMSIKLKYNQDWPEWYNSLRYHSSILGIWNRLNPDPDNATATPEPVIPDSVKKFTKALDRYKNEVKRWSAKPPVFRGPPPQAPKLPENASTNALPSNSGVTTSNQLSITLISKYKQLIYKFINGFMDKAILRPLQTKLLISNDTTLKGLIRKLKKTLNPTRKDAVEKARKDYWNHLTNAGRAQNPRDWVLQWKTLYLTAKFYQIRKVEGSLAVTDFLVAVRKKVAPNWAHNLILSQNNKIV